MRKKVKTDVQKYLESIEEAGGTLGIYTKEHLGKVNTSPTGSLRYNEGKPEVSQLDPSFILDLADLITKSAEKYGRGNYAKGQMFSTPFDSCMRHLLKFQSGEELDSESLKSHLLHAAANVMILYNSWKKDNPELDNRIDFDG